MARDTVQRHDTSRGLGSVKPDDGSADPSVRPSAPGQSSRAGLTAGQCVDFGTGTDPLSLRARSVRSA